MDHTQTTTIVQSLETLSSVCLGKKTYVHIFTGLMFTDLVQRGGEFGLVYCQRGVNLVIRMAMDMDMVIGLIVCAGVLACLVALVLWSVRSIERIARSGCSTARKALKEINSGK